MFRIYPIYWIIASLKIGGLLLLPTMVSSDGNGTAYLLKSWFLLPQDKLPVIGAAWTLSYELLFYLLFGTIILFGARWAVGGAVVWAVAIITYYGLTHGGVLTTPPSQTAAFLLNERNLEFLLGALSAFWLLKGDVPKGGYWLAAGVGLFFFSGWSVNIRGGAEPASFVLTFGLASLLLILGSVTLERQQKLKWPAWLIFLGDASYSIYLTHVMFINVYFIIMVRTGLVDFLGLFGMTLMVTVVAVGSGALFYYGVERPLVARLRARFITRKISFPAPE